MKKVRKIVKKVNKHRNQNLKKLIIFKRNGGDSVFKYSFNAIVAGRKRKKGGQGGGSNGNNVKYFFKKIIQIGLKPKSRKKV